MCDLGVYFGLGLVIDWSSIHIPIQDGKKA